MTPAEQLTSLCILVCDDVYRDERTKKHILVGTFNQISTTVIPCQHPRMCVFVALTNGHGAYELSLRIEHAATEQTLIDVKGMLQVPDPLQVVEMNIELMGLTFHAAGKYWVQVWTGETLIAQRPFLVEHRAAQEMA